MAAGSHEDSHSVTALQYLRLVVSIEGNGGIPDPWPLRLPPLSSV